MTISFLLTASALWSAGGLRSAASSTVPTKKTSTQTQSRPGFPKVSNAWRAKCAGTTLDICCMRLQTDGSGLGDGVEWCELHVFGHSDNVIGLSLSNCVQSVAIALLVLYLQ